MIRRLRPDAAALQEAPVLLSLPFVIGDYAGGKLFPIFADIPCRCHVVDVVPRWDGHTALFTTEFTEATEESTNRTRDTEPPSP